MTRTLSPLEIASIGETAGRQRRVGDLTGEAASLSLLGLEPHPTSAAYGSNPVPPGDAGSYNEGLNAELLGQRFTKYRVEGAPAQTVLNQSVDVDQAAGNGRLWEMVLAGVVVFTITLLFRK